jgi:uncharacterized membrane protein
MYHSYTVLLLHSICIAHHLTSGGCTSLVLGASLVSWEEMGERVLKKFIKKRSVIRTFHCVHSMSNDHFILGAG